ncbi:NADP-dependent oxidoreductase domain-containing protein [Pelagophyceae sp. CCMP2097]|nr:NADP-dependent oxidoreductase domain-containing protein [Pelagophyceae sp. CCMP2097]
MVLGMRLLAYVSAVQALAPLMPMAPQLSTEMKKVQLGSSDLFVSEVCLGTMTWGKQNTLEEGVLQLNEAVDSMGINFIDTAEMYPVPTEAATQGATDRCIGEWLKRRGKRDDVVIASKVCGYSDRITWLRDDKASSRVNRKQILESVDKTLERLDSDYIDLLQIHWPDRYVSLFGGGSYAKALERPDSVPFEEQLSALQEVIASGKVRHIGVSNETPYGVCKFAEMAEYKSLPKICSIQNSYSLLVRSDFESGLTEVCSQTDVGLLAYSPLAGGILTGKYATESPPKEARLNLFPGFMDRYQQSTAREAVDKYIGIAKTYEMTPAQLALAWCYSRPHVTSTIIGETSIEQLRENAGAYSIELPAEALAEIEDVYRRYRDPSKA